MENKTTKLCPSVYEKRTFGLPCFCTLESGHSGPHTAKDLSGEIVKTWTDKKIEALK